MVNTLDSDLAGKQATYPVTAASLLLIIHQNAPFKSKNPPGGNIVSLTGFNHK